MCRKSPFHGTTKRDSSQLELIVLMCLYLIGFGLLAINPHMFGDDESDDHTDEIWEETLPGNGTVEKAYWSLVIRTSQWVEQALKGGKRNLGRLK
jgi:hypothetical protein